MENTIILTAPGGTLTNLENLAMKLEYLEGITQVCANAFGSPGALGAVNEQDVQNAFLSLHEQVTALENEAHQIIEGIMDYNKQPNTKEPF